VTQTISGQQALIALAGPANRQGRMAADNMLAAPGCALQRYKGTLGTAILKAFDLAAACTGLNETQLQANGLPYRATITHSGSHASYYPGAKQLSLKLLYSPEGQIYGAQAVGADGADKRVDVIAAAIHGGLTVQDLCELELAYAPPFGSAKDPINIAGYVASNVLNGSHEVVTWRELRALDTANTVQLVDVRTPEEFEIGTLPNARNLELDHLRERLGQLDKNRPVVVFCQIGMRGYLAYRILKQKGFADVRNLTGGLKTYSWATEKQSNPDIFDYEDIKRRDQAEIEADMGGACAVVGQTSDRHMLDAVGLQCPGPIMKTYRAVEAMQAGELLEVTASDPAFGRDIRAWAKKTNNDVLNVDATKGLIKVLLRKGQGGAPAAVVATGQVAVKDKFTLVVFSDDLDKVMASMIMANGALAMGKPVSLFFTFWGLNVLRRSPAPHLDKSMMDRMFGAMLPAGIEHLDSISKLNNAGLGVKLLRKVMRDKHVEDPASLLASLIEGGAQLIACQMSMDVMGIQHEELIDGVELGGVAAFLGEAQESGTTLFI
jgi:tRNA 2-thiouridine synthesizing protein A